MIELRNEWIQATVLERGATLWTVRLAGHPAADGVCVAHPSPDDYAVNVPYFGTTPGPVANRIGGSRFTLDGQTYQLEPNEGIHHLHGGPHGFARQVWEKLQVSDNAVTLGLRRPDGAGGYPGNLEVSVSWSLVENRLRMEWRAESDAPTPVALTNHAYWNLAGWYPAAPGTILDHRLTVGADHFVVVDDELIPTGEIGEVADGRVDLRSTPALGEAIAAVGGNGLDHFLVLRDGSEPIVLHDPETATTLAVRTSCPGVQVYTGGFLDGSAECAGAPRFGGVCLETQNHSDAINQPSFPSPVDRPGEPISAWTEYVFARSEWDALDLAERLDAGDDSAGDHSGGAGSGASSGLADRRVDDPTDPGHR